MLLSIYLAKNLSLFFLYQNQNHCQEQLIFPLEYIIKKLGLNAVLWKEGMMGLERVVLFVLLSILPSMPSLGEAQVPKLRQEALLKNPAPPGCQWFWVRNQDGAPRGWFTVNKEGEPDLDSPIKCLKYPNGEFLFPDMSPGIFKDPDSPPLFQEFGCVPLRLPSWQGGAGDNGCFPVPMGRWEWTCG